MVLTRRDWAGAEHFPATGGFVVCPNHISYVDPFAFAHFLYDNGHPPFFLAKSEVFEIPILGRLLTWAQQIPVQRGTDQAAKAFSAAVAAVQDGKCVPIFPEGTLTRDPQMWPMTARTGAARVALTTRCPVIPVAQWGPQQIQRPYAKTLHLFPRKTMRMLDAITAQLETIRGEKAPAVRFDSRTAGVAQIGNPKKRRPKKSARTMNGGST
jgi:1-acyl-sn-glycerol-3-phosphate acyltransferase